MKDSNSSENVIFVAMPGVMEGTGAQWKDVDGIKRYLYERIALEVSAATGVTYKVRIEVDEYRAGDIYRSMFGAAMRAPVYIADLTGRNANVYLELGVRWAVKDNVTVLTCQSTDDLAFNVSKGKAVLYGSAPGILEAAVGRIVKVIVEGLRKPDHVDSLVRESAELITLERREYEELRAENSRLARERGDDLIQAARTAEHKKKLELLHQAVEVNPASLEAHFLIGQAAVESGKEPEDYEPAIRHLTEATRLDAAYTPAWRQLGVAQSRSGALEDAIISLNRAIALDTEDAEAYSNLGGVYRRKARAHHEATGSYDTNTLQQAREAYARAGEIDDGNTYPLMNVARLDLQLAGHDDVRKAKALGQFDELKDLARYSARRKGDEDQWKWFDLADALAFTGQRDEAVDAAREGLRRLDEPRRATSGTAAAEPLDDILNSTALPSQVESAVRALITAYRSWRP